MSPGQERRKPRRAAAGRIKDKRRPAMWLLSPCGAGWEGPEPQGPPPKADGHGLHGAMERTGPLCVGNAPHSARKTPKDQWQRLGWILARQQPPNSGAGSRPSHILWVARLCKRRKLPVRAPEIRGKSGIAAWGVSELPCVAVLLGSGTLSPAGGCPLTGSGVGRSGPPRAHHLQVQRIRLQERHRHRVCPAR